jgi:predicted 2-oxoglutarate/Fe(II)-dependent dioxygenase YbiX
MDLVSKNKLRNYKRRLGVCKMTFFKKNRTMKRTKIADEVYIIEDFFTPEECQYWIDFGEKKGYKLAKINMGFRQQVVNTGIRNNKRVIHDSVSLAQEIWQRIEPFVVTETPRGIAIGVNERFRFYRYTVGQEFKPHRDGSFIRNIKEWSAYTLIIYLNENIIGGETDFFNFKLQPKQGNALLFKHEIRHAGLPVTEGVKYVLRTDVMYKNKDYV